MSITTPYFVLLLILPNVVFGAVLTACPESPDCVTIGFSSSNTGVRALEGQDMQRGYLLWATTVNSRGGIDTPLGRRRVSLIGYDDESDSSKVVSLYTRLIMEDEVDFLFGPYSSSFTALAMSVSEERKKILIFSQGADETLFDGGGNLTFGIMTGGSKYFVPVLDSLHASGARTIAVLRNNAGFTESVYNGLSEYSAALGMEIVAEHLFPTSASDDVVSGLVDSLASAAPDADVLVLLTFLSRAAVVLEAVRSSPLRPKAIVAQSGPASPEWVEAHTDLALNVLGTTHWHWEEVVSGDFFGSASDFSAIYKSEFPDGNRHASSYAAGGAATGLVLAEALRTARSMDSNDVAASLREVDLQTFYGHVRFNAKGQNEASSVVMTQVLQPDPRQPPAIAVVAPASSASAHLIYPIPLDGPSDGGNATTNAGSRPHDLWAVVAGAAMVFLALC